MKIQKLLKILTLITSAIALTTTSLWIGKQAYSWLPPEAAAESRLVDDLFSFLVTLGAFIFLGVTGTLMYSIIFHRAKKGEICDGPPIEGNVTLEVVWTAIPILLVFWIAGYSYQIYEQMGIQGPNHLMHLHMPMGMESAYAEPIEDKGTRRQGDKGNILDSFSASFEVASNSEPVEQIDVLAKQWAWVFHYPEKNVTSTELHLPSDRRVRLALQSEDVLHGFYVPAFRLKQDIVPNETINFEFTPIRSGKYRLTDSQYSGTYFATMQADVVVESPEDYHQWLAKAATHKPSPASNQAASEYAQVVNQSFPTGWATVAPAEPPVVNYPG
ncbi:cytochrome c oxidase subunit II [Chlorogloeopsis fritschii PCC 9212]|uniref:Cytochrome c oxidase subunit 2 n=1 Tax=Chlorogloeopsis fritschii PCC 6912 TaxID=211165 RepID=A0A3S0Y0V8_CHLFR|nr:cytochrome c oxidase subunit II [Chlorogloeopsis fritschii]RUR73917.1 cytochrome c oxidase subunit 2 [Chlorogloeopsis fritschii PCC 6912]